MITVISNSIKDNNINNNNDFDLQEVISGSIADTKYSLANLENMFSSTKSNNNPFINSETKK